MGQQQSRMAQLRRDEQEIEVLREQLAILGLGQPASLSQLNSEDNANPAPTTSQAAPREEVPVLSTHVRESSPYTQRKWAHGREENNNPKYPSTPPKHLLGVFDPSTSKMSTNTDGGQVLKKEKPKLLLMGPKRSGKSSISNVVFRKMPPQETLFLETTTTIQKEATHTFMDFQIWDLPGQIDYLDPDFDVDTIFGGVGAMIYILDAVDNYMEPVARLTETILYLRDLYPDIKYAAFIHKTDSLSDDYRDDTVRDITQRITDDLFDAGFENPPLSFHSTSIYDCTIFEAFSKVMQGLVTELPAFEALLDNIKASCRFEKVYLFDVWSKIYIASDTTPVDLKAYELCSDYINIIVDLSEVYGWQRDWTKDEEAKVKELEKEGAESMVTNFKGYSLYLREIDRNLSFIGISKADFEQEKPMIDHNVRVLRHKLLEVMKRKA